MGAFFNSLVYIYGSLIFTSTGSILQGGSLMHSAIFMGTIFMGTIFMGTIFMSTYLWILYHKLPSFF